jgi:hypothetical protein
MIGIGGEGESGLIGRNDNLLLIIRRLAELDYFSRDLHDQSTELATRSDATIGKSNCALLLVEEKQVSMSAAIADFKRKFQWIPYYHKMPFVFQFAITRSTLKIFQIDQGSYCTEIFTADLGTVSGKWACVIAAVNVARVLKYFINQDLFVAPELPIGVWHQRGLQKSIRLNLKFVEVKYNDALLFSELAVFYQRCASVPFLERLISSFWPTRNSLL